MLLSKCAVCGRKKPNYIKQHEANGLLSKLGLKTLLCKIPLLGDILFCMELDSYYGNSTEIILI